MSLADYPTLDSVVGFVRTHRPDLAPQAAQAAEPTAAAPEPEAAPDSGSGWDLARADEVPRRVPMPRLRPPLELCQSTGVELGPASRVLLAKDRGGVARSLASRLEKRGVTVLSLDPTAEPQAMEAQLDQLLAEGPIQGVYWLPALDVEPVLQEMDPQAWRAAVTSRVKNLYRVMRRLYDVVCEPGSFLVSATRLGGHHGYGPDGASAPLGGAVAGFTKAYRQERLQTLVKVVDFAPSRRSVEPAETLLAETLSDPGAVEVGHRDGLRFGVVLQERPLPPTAPAAQLGRDTVFLVTGAAGGITSAIVSDLAAASGGVFHLLDRVPAPRQGHPDLELFERDQVALKRKLADDLRQQGRRPTPRNIDRELMTLEREAALLASIQVARGAGATVHYHQADLLDGEAVQGIVERLRQRHERIDVLLHAAGLEVSRVLADKEPQEFDLVFDVKAEGLFHLLRATRGMPLGAVMVFSSIAARFGNRGQADYAAANDLLCKLMCSLRHWRPETRGIAIDWTAWQDIGMATRGSLPRILKLAGIELLPPAVGVPTVRRELSCSQASGELLVGQGLGALADDPHASGGLDPDRLAQRLSNGGGAFLAAGELRAARCSGGLEIEIDYDPQRQPFLADHQVRAGTPWLPGVVGTELFAELACLMAPGMTVAAVQDLVFRSPLKFHRNQPRTLLLRAAAGPSDEAGALRVHATLESILRPTQADIAERRQLHFSADLLLSRDPPNLPTAMSANALVPDEGALEVRRDEIYRIYFHGPSYQVLDKVHVQGDVAVGKLAADLPPETARQDDALLAPRLLELCFQSAGQWEISTRKQLCLPRSVESAIVFERGAAPAEGLHSRVRAREGGDAFDIEVADEGGKILVAVKGYRTVRLANLQGES